MSSPSGRSVTVGEQLLVGTRAGHCDSAENALGRIRQPRHAADEDVAERARHGSRIGVDIVVPEPARDDLLGEEGIALRPGVDPLDDAARGPAAQDRRELLTLLGEIERPQVEALDQGIAGDLGQPHQQRMAALDVLGAERGHEHDAPLGEVPSQEAEEIAGRRIAPVQVLEHEHERSVAAQAIHEGEGELEQPRLVGRATGRLRGCARGRAAGARGDRGIVEWRQEAGETRGDSHQLRADLAEKLGKGVRLQLPAERPERLEEWSVRDALAAEVHAAPDQDAGTGLPRGRGELVHESRLAEARVAADEDDRRSAGLGPPQGGFECKQFGRAPDKDRAR